MIKRIRYIISTDTNPYKNLALEEYLLKHVTEEECILYLWQNERTVVIGKNQNPWKECKIAELESVGGKLVRRLSGGGAVFHDLGNLNFTFLVTKDNYNVERQLEVILEAVRQRGIPAEKTGRNDISVEGRKFSGNAFYSEGHQCYHHGTLLINVDMSMLSHYLNVSRDKLKSKGVESVRSRVTNLIEYDTTLTLASMKQELIHAFRKVYELEPECFCMERGEHEELRELENKYASWEWNYGKKLDFNYSLRHRYSWGDIDLNLVISSGVIKDCICYSDALETQLFEKLNHSLLGCPFSSIQILQALEKIPITSETIEMLRDIKELVRSESI